MIIRKIFRSMRFAGRSCHSHDLRMVRMLILFVTVALAFLPLWLAAEKNTVLSNHAEAAINHEAPAALTKSARDRQGRVLRHGLERSLEKLQGLGAQDVMLAFSQPQLRRKEGPLRIWQYRNNVCIMDIYFQEQGGTDMFSVVHYEVRPNSKAFLKPSDSQQKPAEPAARPCVRALLKNADHNAMVTAAR